MANNNGDKVVCVQTHSANLVRKGGVYTIVSVCICKQCRKTFYELAEVPISSSKYNGTVCPACYIMISLGYLVFASFLFAPLNSNFSKDIAMDYKETKEGLEILIPAPMEVAHE